jgi:hypothetical protein
LPNGKPRVQLTSLYLRHDTQHNVTQHYDIQHKDTQHNEKKT